MYEKLTIELKSGESYEFKGDEWSNYDLIHGFIVVFGEHGEWMAIFAKDEVKFVTMDKK